MNKINYQKELERLIDKLPDHHRRLFLHSCCAPCSSYCLEYLRQYFDVTVFYYNPNISFLEEYRHRVEELKRLVSTLNEEAKGSEMLNQIALLEGTYEPENFSRRRKGWRTVRRAESAALSATSCGCGKRRGWRQRAAMIFYNNADDQSAEKCAEAQRNRQPTGGGISCGVPAVGF